MKSFVLTESQMRMVLENCAEGKCIIEYDKYNEVMNHLRKHYKMETKKELNANYDFVPVSRAYLIDDFGMPVVEKDYNSILLKLDDTYHKIYNDDKLRYAFLSHVLNDWSKGLTRTSKNIIYY